MRPELDLFGPALEVSIAVAREGESSEPVVAAPRTLRPLLRFGHLPPRAREVVVAALDDDAFRERVAAATDEASVGRAGWLLLTRPDGWEVELASLVEDRRRRGDARGEHRARRQVEGLRAALDESERSRALAEQEVDRWRAEALAARSEAQSLRAERDGVAGLLEQAVDDRARAVRELKATERRLAERTAEVRLLRSADPTDGSAAASGSAPASPAEPGPSPAGMDALFPLVEQLRVALGAAGESLDGLAAAVERTGRGDASGSGDGRAAGPARVAPPGARSRRRPIALRGGLVESTPDALSWLLDQDGAIVLVDGYNVSMLAWPELPAGEQRRALEQAIVHLQRRRQAQFVLVFDGDGDDVESGAAVRTGVGSPVRVRFTRHDVEADDEILRLIEVSTAPVVVVVSNDRRVRDGARDRGANVARSTDLVALVR